MHAAVALAAMDRVRCKSLFVLYSTDPLDLADCDPCTLEQRTMPPVCACIRHCVCGHVPLLNKQALQFVNPNNYDNEHQQPAAEDAADGHEWWLEEEQVVGQDGDDEYWAEAEREDCTVPEEGYWAEEDGFWPEEEQEDREEDECADECADSQ